jgi:hypothetical protein
MVLLPGMVGYNLYLQRNLITGTDFWEILMAVGYSTYTANKTLDALYNNTSFAVTNSYMQLHVGDPGAAGTSNPAAETTRKSLSFGVASSAEIANDAQIVWTNITGSETATHFTIWDASTGGNFLWSGTMSANPHTDGDTLTVAVGDLDISMTPAG